MKNKEFVIHFGSASIRLKKQAVTPMSWAMKADKCEMPKPKLLLRVSWGVFGVLWLLAIAIGFRVLWIYELTPGAITTVPAAWPRASTISRSSKKATLLVFAHPHCPCTRASLSELSVLLTAIYGQLDTYILLLAPSTQEPTWADTHITDSVTTMPGVQVIKDTDGREAQLFGSITSGHVLLYDTNGHLRFSGGITAARGHIGDNAGRQSLTTLVRTGMTTAPQTPVFGCPLFYDNRND